MIGMMKKIAALGVVGVTAAASAQPVDVDHFALGYPNQVMVFDNSATNYMVFPNTMSSVEFDNAFGLSHNASGNLLSLQFGNELRNLATDGSGGVQILGPTLPAGHEAWGLSVSPNNKQIALVDLPQRTVAVWDYFEGAAGTAVGATIFNQRVAPANSLSQSDFIGTTWLDDQTVLALDTNGDLLAFRVTAAAVIPLGPQLTIPLPFAGGDRHTDIYFCEDIDPLSPKVYMWDSRVSGGGVIRNELTVVDPATWTIVGQWNYNNSVGVVWEMAFDAGCNLYVNQYRTGLPCPGRLDIIDLIVGAANVKLLRDDGSLDIGVRPALCGQEGGLDVAKTTDVCPADFNGDGVVNTQDVLAFLNIFTLGC